MNPQELLERCAGDTGQRSSIEIAAASSGGHILPGTFIEKVTFETEFVRQAYFRFSYRRRYGLSERWDHRTIEMDGDEVRTTLEIPVSRPALRAVIAFATGVSAGAAHDIPALLMSPLIGGRTALEIENPVLVEEADVDGCRCYGVTEDPSKKHEVTRTLWIETTSLLLRRMETSQEAGRSKVTPERSIIRASNFHREPGGRGIARALALEWTGRS
jgi:hypothetical protein